MAKQSGLGSSLYVAQYDLSGDVGAISTLACPRAEQDVSAINESATERILLRRDGTLAYNSFWNTTAGQAEAVLAAIARADTITSVFVGNTVGSAAASMIAKNVDYNIAYGADGSLGATTDAHGSGYGLEWSGGGTGDGMLTTGKQSFATGTVDGTSIDLGSASTLFGAAGYIHVMTMPSGTATFAIQDSADNSTFADVTGLVFTALTGPGSERKQTAAGATIRRYVRLEGRGTHGTSLVACNFIRYLTADAFSA
jgi:hypothetical protein